MIPPNWDLIIWPVFIFCHNSKILFSLFFLPRLSTSVHAVFSSFHLKQNNNEPPPPRSLLFCPHFQPLLPCCHASCKSHLVSRPQRSLLVAGAVVWCCVCVGFCIHQHWKLHYQLSSWVSLGLYSLACAKGFLNNSELKKGERGEEGPMLLNRKVSWDGGRSPAP